MANHPKAILAWKNEGAGYAPGFKIGSTGPGGEHLRSLCGWPFSVYREANEVGGCDACLCTGIQSLGDAVAVCAMLNRAAFNEDAPAPPALADPADVLKRLDAIRCWLAPPKSGEVAAVRELDSLIEDITAEVSEEASRRAEA